MKLWITGANGFLGKAIQKACKEKSISSIATFRDEVDISSLTQVNRFLEAHSQDPFTHIVNCAALAHVDLAEKNPSAAFSVNALGPENLGKGASSAGLNVLHFSTEYIFNGSTSSGPFKEDDLPSPVGVYASTKREGELRLLDACPQSCIIRTSWLFGGEGKTFLSSLFDRIRKERILFVASDQKGRATYVEDLVDSLSFFLQRSGIFHFANQEETSRYEIALWMKNYAIERAIPICCEQIEPTSSDRFIQDNKRPMHCTLDTTKVETLQNKPIRSWKEAGKDLVQQSQRSSSLCP